MDVQHNKHGGLLTVSAGWLKRLAQAWSLVDKKSSPIEQLIEDLRHGECPRCLAVHPESAIHTDTDSFWSNFVCPECTYTLKVHVKSD